jgi:hypothetical protein
LRSAPIQPEPINCIALARTSSKLTVVLLLQLGIASSLLSAHLTIIQGDARDNESLKLFLTTNGEESGVVDTIIKGLGGTPKLQNSLRRPVTLDNPTICEDAARTLISALEALRSEGTLHEDRKPLLGLIPTTGHQLRERRRPLVVQMNVS